MSSFLMISIWNVSFELPLLKNKPVTSDDVKYFDDFDVKSQFRIAFIQEYTVTSDDVKYFDHFDVKCQFRIAFIEE